MKASDVRSMLIEEDAIVEINSAGKEHRMDFESCSMMFVCADRVYVKIGAVKACVIKPANYEELCDVLQALKPLAGKSGFKVR